MHLSENIDMAAGTLCHKLEACWWPLITGKRSQHANSFEQTKTLLARQNDGVSGLHDHALAS